MRKPSARACSSPCRNSVACFGCSLARVVSVDRKDPAAHPAGSKLHPQPLSQEGVACFSKSGEPEVLQNPSPNVGEGFRV